MCAEVAAAGDQRVVISRETFCMAREAAIRRVVDGLGGPRVHVLITLRPLTRILPSAWQQNVRNRSIDPYETWLDQIFNPPPERPNPPFWTRHRHEDVVQRWASVVGPDRVTVLVVDDFEGAQLLRPIEQMLGLPDELLQLAPRGANRSLTYPEIELVRQVGARFTKRRWSDEFYRDIVRHGMVRRLQRTRAPDSDESKIVTPKWALDRAAEIGAAASEGIAASGVRILGDITTLGTAPGKADAEPDATDGTGSLLFPVSAATEVVFGTIMAGIQREKALARDLRQLNAREAASRRRAEHIEAKGPPVGDVRSTQLLSIVAGRARRRLRRKLRRKLRRSS